MIATLLSRLSPLLLGLLQDAPGAAGPVQPPAATVGWSPSAALVGRAADLDRSGDVTPAEWARFVADLRLDERGRYERDDVIARVLRPLLDADGDGWIGVDELRAARARWDADADGDVDGAEFARGARSLEGEATFVEELVLRLSDGWVAQTGADQPAEGERDGTSTAEEWEAFLSDQTRRGDTDELAPSALLTWLARARGLDVDDRNAFSPDVYLLTLAAELDADKDGALRPADLWAHLAALDADGDGALSADELAEPDELPPGSARPRFERSVAEQREQPPRMPFQRSLADALLLVERTGKPLLVCVNMDGENASEEFAWYRYRDPAFSDLARGFVCVVASPDRRQPYDYDDRGRRLPDERFGRVVDAEHIAIEPELFERYFSGTRAAPRHVGVAPDGRILFDIFLVQDLSVVDAALAEHAVRPGERPRPADELALDELFASPEHEHRAFLESYFVSADALRRVPLLARALDPARRVMHPQLVRLGLHDDDVRVRAAAVAAVAARPGAVGEDLVHRAFFEAQGAAASATGPAAERDDATARRDALIDGLRRLVRAGEDELRVAFARRVLAVHTGLTAQSRVVDASRFAARLAVAPPVPDPFGVASDLDPAIAALEKVAPLLDADPDDAGALVLFAAANLRVGRATLAGGGNPLFYFQDAAQAARRAGGAGAAELARASWLLSEFDAAEAAAEVALGDLADRAQAPIALEVLRVFARTRVRRIYDAYGSGARVDATDVADVAAAHRVIALHPGANADDAIARAGFLGAIDAWREQSHAVEEGLRRHPGDEDLHAWRRSTLLRAGGARALSRWYADWSANKGDQPFARWWEGLALLFAAEHAVRVRDDAFALACYRDCTAAFEEVGASDSRYLASSAHYAALASAGAARRHAERKDFAAAVAAIEAAFAHASAAPAALEATDGLGVTPRESLDGLVETLLARGARPQDGAQDGAQDRDGARPSLGALLARCSALLGE